MKRCAPLFALVRPLVNALLVATVLCLCTAAQARPLFHSDLIQAEDELSKADGPRAYSALRRIWALSASIDPHHIEDALTRASTDRRLSAPVRVYAALLGAYARTRRGDGHGAKQAIAALGFVNDWLVLGPFDNEGKAGFGMTFAPEQEPLAQILPGQAFTGKERPVRWRAVPDKVFPFGFLDSGALLRPETQICLFAATLVSSNAPLRRPKPISLWVGAHGAYKLFWNGSQVLEDSAYRGYDADRRAVQVELKAGQNHVLVKLCGEQQAPVLALRLAAANGAPDPSLIASNDIALTTKLEAATFSQTRGPLGPLQVMERALEKKPRAQELYDFAEYLALTNGDDPATHQSRDLARQASEQEPNALRLLLAAELAEDKNQAREWVNKAEKLVSAGSRESIDVLLAQAALRRLSPNPREAFPFYDRVLAIDPNNISAIRGRVELYNAAGLKLSALRMLESATARQPHALNLLNMLSSQLHSVGRTTDATEAEERYASLRADDQGYLAERLNLAVERREQAGVEHWAERLLEFHPDSLWAYEAVAKAYRGIGQTERAIGTLGIASSLAPEEVGTLRSLADLYGTLGQRDKQLDYLKRILAVRPQDKAARDYLSHAQPAKAKPDERYAMEPEKFLVLRHAPAAGRAIRTLRDLTVTTVYPNGLSSRFRQIAFQPLTDAAAASARQYAFSYEADRAEVQLRGAKVFRGDGRIDEAIEYGEAPADDPSIAMYTSSRNFYIQFPRLESGDVVELRYRIDDTTPRNDFADYFGEVTYLQSTEPVQLAEYVLIAPKSKRLYIDENLPGLKRSIKDKGDQRIYRFFSESVAPLQKEPMMPPLAEMLGFVHVSTYKTYEDLGRWYWGLSRDQLELDDETRKLTREIVADASTELDKVKAVFDWVVKNTRYVALELGIHGFKPRRCVQTVARGWGDCKDKATVIVSMLRELGIDSTLVIVRTQMRGGFNSKIPSLAVYDHAIAYVPKFDLYLDGTAEFSGATELPRMDLGGKAILVNQGNAKAVELPQPDPTKNVIERTLNARLNGDGSADVQLGYRVEGVDASGWRKRYHNQATLRDRVNEDLSSEFQGFELTPGEAGVKSNDLQDFNAPVSLEVQGKAPSFAQVQGRRLSLDLALSVRLTPTYAALSKRRTPVRILAFASRLHTSKVRLPAGAKIVSRPPNVDVKSAFGRYAVAVEVDGQWVTVTSRLEVHKSRIGPKDYAAWKQFCLDADQALSHPVIVER